MKSWLTAIGAGIVGVVLVFWLCSVDFTPKKTTTTRTTKTTVTTPTPAPEPTPKPLEIVDMEMTDRKYSSDYYDFYIKFQNNSGRTIRYIKYDVFFKDAEKNIIDTDWSNWSGPLPDGAQVSDTTIIEKPRDDWEWYSVVISEISYK